MRLAETKVAHDVLAHDDRVVDQQPDAKAQGHQRQKIEGEAERVKRNKGRDHRDRQGEPGDDRAAPTVQEQKHDQYREHRAFDDRFLDAIDAALDRIRGRIDHPQLDLGGQALLEERDRLGDAMPGVDDIRILRFLKIERDRRAAVDARDRVLLFLPVDDGRDLGQVDRSASLLRDDDPSELHRVLDLAFDPDDRVGRTSRDATGRHVLVGGANGVDDLIDAQAQRGERLRLDLDQNLPCYAPVDVNSRDARNVLEPFDDGLVGQRAQVTQPDGFGQHRDRHHRLRIFLVGADDQRILHIARESWPHLCDLVADVLHRAHHFRAYPEFGKDFAAPFARIGPNQLHAGHRVDRVLERLGDVRLDDLG